MIKVQATQDFKFSSMDKITNLKRARFEKENYIYKNDTFECNEEMVKYLSGENQEGVNVIKVIEVIPKKSKK